MSFFVEKGHGEVISMELPIHSHNNVVSMIVSGKKWLLYDAIHICI